tara:strand:- start:239 stop:649 length:411 start_codon:yes stop_codon:yes gene_type:complete
MVAGAPRKVSPSPEECVKLGEELVKWALEEDKKNPHIIFQQFYSIIKRIPRRSWKAIVQIPEFLPYYEEAQAALAIRCMNGGMEKSFGHRYIRLYDNEIKNEENDLLRLKAKLAREQKEDDRNTSIEDIRNALKGD